MNTPEEHASAVMRAPGSITVASVAGAIRSYAEEVKGSQLADADKLAAVTAELETEREAVAALGRSFDAMRAERDVVLEKLSDCERALDVAGDQLSIEARNANDAYAARAKAVAERDAERAARKALGNALRSANCRCSQIHHAKSDWHDYDVPCPIAARIAAALELAAKL